MTIPGREHSRAWTWTRDYTIGLALGLLCAIAVMLLAGQAHRLLRAALGEPYGTSSRPHGTASSAAPSSPSSTRSTRTATQPPPADPLPDGSTPKGAAPSAEARHSQPPETTSGGARTTTGASAATPAEVEAITRELQQRGLMIPIPGVEAKALARGSFREERTGHAHEALDILAPRGTPIVAVDEGRIAKLFWSDAGGHTIYQFDPTNRVAYYYAHLDRYADGLKEGQTIRRGDIIGFVGSSGNARPTAPHLHFAIFVLTAERQWWKGTAIDPYPVFVPEPPPS